MDEKMFTVKSNRVESDYNDGFHKNTSHIKYKDIRILTGSQALTEEVQSSIFGI
jgi:hypothetical protein